MGFKYSIDPTLRLVKVDSGQDFPAADDFLAVLDQLGRDPLFGPGFGVLFERRQFTKEPDAQYVRASIENIAARGGKFTQARWASITSHLATYGMGRMAEAIAENCGVSYRVFIDEREAMDWLLDTELRDEQPDA